MPTPESKFQSQVIKFLKSKGAMTLKYEQNATTHAGVADIVWFYKTKYGFLETKKSKDAPFRPGQKLFLEKMSKWTFAKAVFPENYDIIKREIMDIIRNEDLQSSRL